MKKTILSLVAAMSLTTSTYASDKVYATVNNQDITSADIAAMIRNPKVNFDSLPKEQQKKVLEDIIEQTLLSQNAVHSDIVKTEEYKTQLEKIKQSLAVQLWAQSIAKDIKPSEADLKKYYEQHKAQLVKPLQMKASHILVEKESDAKEIIKSLEKSKSLKSDFSKMAKEKSIGPSGPNGGELPWFVEGQMVPEFTQATMKLEKGTITKQPVKSKYGYHVIYLEDKKDPTTLAFEEIKPQIAQQVSQEIFMQKLKAIATGLKSKAKIEYK